MSKETAAAQNCFQESDGVSTDSRCSEQLVERCHNSVGQGSRSVDAGSLSLRVDQELETREIMRIMLVEDDLDLAQSSSAP